MSTQSQTTNTRTGTILMQITAVLAFLHLISFFRMLTSVVIFALKIIRAGFSLLIRLTSMFKKLFPLPLFAGLAGSIMYLIRKRRPEQEMEMMAEQLEETAEAQTRRTRSAVH